MSVTASPEQLLEELPALQPHPAPSRLRPSLPGLAGLLAIAALLPLRGVWAADIVLVGLAFTVPGVLALRAARVSGSAVAGYPLYIPVASLAVIIAGGLAGDLLGPLLGVPKPLHGITTAVSTLGLALVLWLIGTRAPSAARVPWRWSLLERPSLLAPLVLPVLAGAGALLLTNGHGELLARVAAVLTVAALGFCLMFAHRLTRAQVGMLLFACALAAEWAFSLRSQRTVGFDISAEINIAQSTQAHGVWHTVQHNNAYAAMLSITVLPSTLAALTGLSPLIAFKALYPVLAAMIPVSTFLLGERIMRRSFAAAAAALVLAQSYFFQTIPELARQEIALVFFAALVFALLDRRLGPTQRVRVVLAMAAGLVVSHYSSTYLAIPMVISAIFLQALVARFRPLSARSAGLACAAVTLLAGGALWYAAITRSDSNLTSFTATFNKSGLNLLPNEHGNVILSYLSGNALASVSGPQFAQLAVQDYRSKSAYVHPLPAATEPRFRLQTATPPVPAVRLPAVADGLKVLVTVLGELMLVLGGVGALLMAFGRRRRYTARLVGVMALATLPMLALIRFSGTVAAAYNQQRALLQSLMLLALPAAWLAERIVLRTRRQKRETAGAAGVALVLLFASQLGVTAILLGGGTSLNLSQGGEDFERLNTTPAELAAGTWASIESTHQLLYADRYGQLRLSASSGRIALTDLTPRTIDRQAWVYGTRTNVVLGRARGEVGNFSSTYRWPAAFLQTYFNTVYNDGDSKVFHR